MHYVEAQDVLTGALVSRSSGALDVLITASVQARPWLGGIRSLVIRDAVGLLYVANDVDDEIMINVSH